MDGVGVLPFSGRLYVLCVSRTHFRVFCVRLAYVFITHTSNLLCYFDGQPTESLNSRCENTIPWSQLCLMLDTSVVVVLFVVTKLLKFEDEISM